MSRLAKLYMRVASAPANTRFADVVRLAQAAGFVVARRRGSHLVLEHPERPQLLLNLQPDKGKAKKYQVRDLLAMIEQEDLWRW